MEQFHDENSAEANGEYPFDEEVEVDEVMEANKEYYELKSKWLLRRILLIGLFGLYLGGIGMGTFWGEVPSMFSWLLVNLILCLLASVGFLFAESRSLVRAIQEQEKRTDQKLDFISEIIERSFQILSLLILLGVSFFDGPGHYYFGFFPLIFPVIFNFFNFFWVIESQADTQTASSIVISDFPIISDLPSPLRRQ